MWSKQADTRAANKNMTSFKNKITNRKRKNSAVPATETDVPVAPLTDPKQNEDKNKQAKSGGKNRNRNRNKKDSNNVGTDNKSSNVHVTNKDAPGLTTTVVIDKDLESADVILRNSVQTNNNAVKRYSDSFVIENNGQVVNARLKIEEAAPQPPALTRAVSGFFIIDQARKARRFSDLFKPNTMKLSNSVENLKMNNEKNSVHLEKKVKESANQSKKNAADKKQIKLDEQRLKQMKKAEKLTPLVSKKEMPVKEQVTGTENSYLRRVKSKIYKTKSDSQANKDDTDSKSKKYKQKKNLGINGSRIPEDEVAVLTPDGVRKPISHFDFRLIRQTSNLERGRPKTIISQSSVDETDTTAKNEKPVLTKAKSSSSINLNMLRTRRNKIMEQVFGTKDVHNEFEFIGFGSVNNVAGLGKSDVVFGSQRSLHKPPSWLHIHKEEKEEKGKCLIHNLLTFYIIFYLCWCR